MKIKLPPLKVLNDLDFSKLLPYIALPSMNEVYTFNCSLYDCVQFKLVNEADDLVNFMQFVLKTVSFTGTL